MGKRARGWKRRRDKSMRERVEPKGPTSPLMRIDEMFGAAFPKRGEGREPVYPTGHDLMWLLAFAKAAYIQARSSEFSCRRIIGEKLGMRPHVVDDPNLSLAQFAEVIRGRIDEAYHAGKDHAQLDAAVSISPVLSLSGNDVTREPEEIDDEPVAAE